MTHLGLFEGIGGFSLAARWAGWQTPVMVEWNQYCQAVLNKNFPDATIFGDIHKFDGRPYAGQIDIITGGFPCQPFSSAGRRAGIDDDRFLWPEMLRVIQEVAPAWVVGENVAGLLSMDGGRVFAGILADLENAGYSTETYLIPAVGVGAPHRRDRVWIVAHRDNIECNRGRRAWHGRPKLANKNCGPTADAERSGWAGRPPAQSGHLLGDRPDGSGQGSGRAFNAPEVAADATRIGKRKQNNQADPIGGSGEAWKDFSRGDWGVHWYEVATRICGMANGIPAGMDGIGSISTKTTKGKAHRLEALGNAIVPQIAYQIFEAINQYHP